MCTCSENIQIILHRCDDLRMKYIYAFNGTCNLSNSYSLNSSGSYWVTIFHENMEGIFEVDILFSNVVKIDGIFFSSTITEMNVTTSAAFSTTTSK